MCNVVCTVYVIVLKFVVIFPQTVHLPIVASPIVIPSSQFIFY